MPPPSVSLPVPVSTPPPRKVLPLATTSPVPVMVAADVLPTTVLFFTVTVHARGLENTFKQLEAAVLDANGEVTGTLPIDAEPFALPADDQTTKVGFRYKFDEPGRYQLRIGVPPEPGEAVKGDNYKRHILRVVELKMRVLMVANQPNYAYRFVKEMLFRAPDNVIAEFPQYPAVNNYEDLKEAIAGASERNIAL